MVGQDKGGPRSIGHDLRQPSRPPGCPYLAADPGDPRVGAAFFPALSPVQRAISAPALAQRQPPTERLAPAPAQPLERRRSAAASCERPCRHVAPAPRQVAAALAHAGA
jgi:hypothetical protein